MTPSEIFNYYRDKANAYQGKEAEERDYALMLRRMRLTNSFMDRAQSAKAHISVAHEMNPLDLGTYLSLHHSSPFSTY